MSAVQPDAGGRRVVRGAAAIGAAGALLSLLGLLVDPRRVAFSYLTACAAALAVALGALSLVMIGRVTGARWLAPLRPAALAAAATVPALALLFVPLLFGLRTLFPWMPPLDRLPPDVRASVARKSAYLNVPFFLVRAVVDFVAWTVLAELLARGTSGRRGLWSAIGLPVFAFTTSFAAVDWLMSLSPAWSSTIYGLYFWSGGFVAALGLLGVLQLVAPPPGEDATAIAERSNTLAKMLLTFTLFWAYVGFSQLLVIWIGDLPREATWYAPRLAGSWAVFGAVLLAGHFALPFAVLLPRRVRERPAAVALVGAWLLVMHYLDVYWLVLPELTRGGVAPHWLDLTTLAAVAGLATAFGAWRFSALAAAEAGPTIEQTAPAAGS